MYRLIIPGFLLAPALAVLAACSAVPLSSLVSLNQIDMARTNLALLRVAVRAPDILRIQDGDVRVHLDMTSQNGALHQSQDFALEAVGKDDRDVGLASEQRPGTAIGVYRLKDRDAQRFEAMRQAALQDAGKKRGKDSMSISVGASGCLLAPRPEALPVSAYLKTEETGKFVKIVDDLDLTKLKDRYPNLPPVKPCEG